MKPDNVKYEALKEKKMAQISVITDLAYPISRDLKLHYESYDWATSKQKEYYAIQATYELGSKLVLCALKDLSKINPEFSQSHLEGKK